MLKKTFMNLGAAALVTGALFFSGGSAALAGGQPQTQPTCMTSDDHEHKWKYHGCYKSEHAAEKECDWLRSKGWDAKWKKENGKYCVYKRKSC